MKVALYRYLHGSGGNVVLEYRERQINTDFLQMGDPVEVDLKQWPEAEQRYLDARRELVQQKIEKLQREVA